MPEDRFQFNENDFYYPICNKCRYYKGNAKCDAFLEGIPEDILTGEFDHTKEYPKQENDIVFEKN